MCLLCKIFGGWGLAPSPESSSNLGIISIVQSGSLVRAKYMQNLQSTGEMVRQPTILLHILHTIC